MIAALTEGPSQTTQLPRADRADDPLDQFAVWLQQAAHGGVAQPLAMSLATVGADGRPLARTVLLKYFDAEGFVFFTHSGSRKVRQMAENPQVSLLFPWLVLNRQVIINGPAGRLGALEAAKCFLLGEQGGVTARAAVGMQLAELRHRFGLGVSLLAPSWAGFRVRPEAIEFWQGRGPRKHERILHVRNGAGRWSAEILD